MAWYNDIFLPDLPEYDAAAYPYACIQWIPYSGAGYIAHLRYSDRPFHAAGGIVTNTSGSVIFVQTYSSSYTDFSWRKAYPLPNPTLSLPEQTVIWCNADISDESGSIFLAASEPIPTRDGTAPDFRLSSWLIGMVIGLAGAA